MQLQLSDDQELLRETTARFVEQESPLTRVRELIDDPMGFDPGWLRAGAGLGWFAMFVPEEHGGGCVSGKPLVDAAIIAEELGRTVQPGPFLATNIVAFALADAGSPEQCAEVLPALASGEAIGTWALADGAGTWNDGGIAATRNGPGFSLSGTRGFVQDAQSADWFLVAASIDGQPAQFLVPRSASGVAVTPLVSFDLARRLGTVTFDGVAADKAALVGEPSGATAQMDRQLDVALALQCAETVGALDVMFDMTLQYSKDRIAFGRPIGSFQALKHIMADLALYLETCKAGAVAASIAVDARTDDASEVASMTKAYVGDVSVDIAQECLQIHGGIGYTWEHDLHLYMRRVSVNNALYGTPAGHRERVCVIHGL
ncbi:MAG: acyl-CoA dehydrogenase family protein [Acidimicrobiia bacterium]